MLLLFVCSVTKTVKKYLKGLCHDISSYFKRLKDIVKSMEPKSNNIIQFVYVILYYSPETRYCLPLSWTAK